MEKKFAVIAGRRVYHAVLRDAWSMCGLFLGAKKVTFYDEKPQGFYICKTCTGQV
jgi:hypothetical protein